MTDKEFFDFAYDEYKSGFDLSNTLYPRCGIILTGLVVLGGAALSFGRSDLATRTFERVDIFLYHLFACAVFTCLAVAVFWLIRAVFPRDYPKVSDLLVWREWRDKYANTLKKDDPTDNTGNDAALQSATLRAMLDRIVEAQAKVAQINQERLLGLQRSIKFSAIAVAALAAQALTTFILKIQGI